LIGADVNPGAHPAESGAEDLALPLSHTIADALARRAFTKVICGVSLRDPEIVSRIATLYTMAGVTVLDVALDVEVVRAARRGIRLAQTLRADVSAPVIMVSLGLGTDPHIGAALLHPSICATCSGCVIEELRLCAERPLEVRSPECPSCMKCLSACPHGAIRFAEQHQDVGTTVAATIAAGAGAVELHVAGAIEAEMAGLYEQIAVRLPTDVWLSLSVGASVEDADAMAAKAVWATALRANVLLQVEGRPMRGDDGSGHSDQLALSAAQALLERAPHIAVQLAGGTTVATRQRAHNAGLQVRGIAFGTAARTAVSVALRGDFEPDGVSFQGALAAATALISAGQPWEGAA
jgi:Fe-S-cluster-containing hydrogenase component 2